MAEIGMNEREYESTTARRQKLRSIHQTVRSILQYYQQVGYIQSYEDDVSSVKIEGEIRDPWSLDRSAFEATTRDLNEEG